MANQAITIERNFNLNKITLDLTKELNRSAQIIKTDHFERLESGQGVKSALVPSKKKSGKTLVNTGKMKEQQNKSKKQMCIPEENNAIQTQRLRWKMLVLFINLERVICQKENGLVLHKKQKKELLRW